MCRSCVQTLISHIYILTPGRAGGRSPAAHVSFGKYLRRRECESGDFQEGGDTQVNRGRTLDTHIKYPPPQIMWMLLAFVFTPPVSALFYPQLRDKCWLLMTTNLSPIGRGGRRMSTFISGENVEAAPL